jgi:hypothetical protein
MSCAGVLFAIASLVFAISLAIPIGLFAYRPELREPFKRVLIWLYLAPIISGGTAVIAGLITITSHLYENRLQAGLVVADILAIISIILVSISLPIGIVKYNRIIVERAAERIYEQSAEKGKL